MEDFEYYKNINGLSNIKMFKITDNYIEVIFNKSDLVYRYEKNMIGEDYFNEMVTRAYNGQGLNGFIRKYIGKNYSKKYKII